MGRKPLINDIGNRRTIRAVIHQTRRLCYRVINRWRGLPDFLIIGAQRCGTTSLYNYMSQHPRILPAIYKEVHFFDWNFSQGMSWYRKRFPQREPHCLLGEASPYYLLHPQCPRRVASLLPHVKLIVLLRNPVDRAYSQYWHEVRRRWEISTFADAVSRDLERLPEERARLLADERSHHAYSPHFLYLTRGIYIEQLKAWRQFFSEDAFLILRSEDFFATPQSALRQVFVFLQIPDIEIDCSIHHQSGSYPPMDPNFRTSLTKFFYSYNQKLYEYLHVPWTWE